MSDYRGCCYCNDTPASHVWQMDNTASDRFVWKDMHEWSVCIDCHNDGLAGTEHRIIDRANALQTCEPIETYTADDLEPLRAGLADSIAYWIEHRTTHKPL